MTIVKKEVIDDVTIYTVDKDIDDAHADNLGNRFVSASMINFIIRDHDADVYAADGKLLLRFRKGALSKTNATAFYDNVIDFAETPTSNRGSTSGSKSKNVYDNPKIMSNIIGFFDRFPPNYKVAFKKAGIKTPLEIRECRFNRDHPDKFKKMIPLVKEINDLYKQYAPDHFEKQNKKAKQTYFKIPGTAFTTITTNVNFKTSIHKDKGDDAEGFGNLAVIEDGKYEGAETCFPQYGIGVDVRTGDMLFMDVHEWHGNLPMKPLEKDAKRLSIVCYLRYKIWLRTKNKTRRFYEKHNHTIRKLTRPGAASRT
jgi:hypothetical protein